MPAIILDGNKIAAEIRAEAAEAVEAMSAAGVRPGLAVVLAGNNPASEIYVRGKVKSCEEVGIYSEKHTPGESVTTDELLSLVDDLNRRNEIDGILVQLPLPPQVDSRRFCLRSIPPKMSTASIPRTLVFCPPSVRDWCLVLRLASWRCSSAAGSSWPGRKLS